MNRQQEIAEIKQNIKIFDLIKSAGLRYWKSGTNKIKIRSLINQDKDPSCIIYLNKNDFFDFSANRGGSVIDFYMLLCNKTYPETMKDLRGMLYHSPVEKMSLKLKLNDYAECRQEFEKLMSFVMSIPKKTKYLKQIKNILKQLNKEIAEKELIEKNNKLEYNITNER